MKSITVLFLLGLPGVARTSRLDARQGTPSGNFSVTLPPQSLTSQKGPLKTDETPVPSLVAAFSRVTVPSSITKQGRGPQGPNGVDRPGPPPEPAPESATSPDLPPPRVESPVVQETVSTSIEVETVIGTTTLALSSSIISNIVAPVETSSTQLTTIVTTSSQLGDSSSPTTFFTSKITSKPTPSVTTSTLGEGFRTTTTAPSSDLTPPPTKTATMSSSTPIPSSVSSNNSESGSSTITIVLSTVLSIAGVILIAVAAYVCTGSRRRRIPVFNRGITPIGDDEIATWKSNRSPEKATDRYTTRPTHSQHGSTSTSTRKAPSLIQYQNGTRPSLEVVSPRSFIGGKQSFELPQAPGAVLARAPNARSGLTDETVPGDDPFLPSPRRHPSRLHKLPPNSPTMNLRKGSRTSSLRSYHETTWRDSAVETSPPRASSDNYLRSYNRIYSNSSIPPPPQLSFGDNEQFTGLSPPPSRRNDGTIGMAVG